MLKQRKLLLPLAVLLTVLLLLGCASAEDRIHMQVEVTYEYSLARDVFPLVNAFRTGPDAWFWNQDGSKTTLTDLAELKYDYGLEKVAMQRAAECAARFAHTRPNGESCFSIYPDSSFRAENIAAGYSSAEAVHTAWREDDDDYSGQGHRRNMLSSYAKTIGIGCVRVDGILFWCQAFGGSETGQSAATLGSTAVIEFSASYLSSSIQSASATVQSVRIPEGATQDVPQISATIQAFYTFSGTLTDPDWQCADGKVTVSGGQLTGAAGGKTTLTWASGSCSVSVPVTVICRTHTPVTDPAVPPTCEGTGLSEGSHCALCDETIEEQRSVPATGHHWGEPDYSWADDNSTVTGKAVCLNDSAHIARETVETTSQRTPPTYDAEGKIVYTAVFTHEAFTTQTREVILPKLVTDITVSGGAYHLDVEKKTATFTGLENSSVKKLTIPATVSANGETYKVTEIAANACKGMKCLTQLTIGENVKKIGKSAFENCSSLKKITVKTKKLTKKGVGKRCFHNIKKKATFKLPSSKKSKYTDWFSGAGKAPSSAKYK